MSAESFGAGRPERNRGEENLTPKQFQELNSLLLLMKASLGESSSIKEVTDLSESNEGLHMATSGSIAGIVERMRNAGIGEDNELMASFVQLDAAQEHLRDLQRQSVDGTDEALREQKVEARRARDEAETNAVDTLRRWQPLITGAF